MILAGRQQIAHRTLPLVSLSMEPLLQVLARRCGELREKQSSAPLVASPDHVRVAMQADVGSRQNAAEFHVRTHWNRFGRLKRESVLADVDADRRRGSRFKLQVNQRLRLEACGPSTVRLFRVP